MGTARCHKHTLQAAGPPESRWSQSRCAHGGAGPHVRAEAPARTASLPTPAGLRPAAPGVTRPPCCLRFLGPAPTRARTARTPLCSCRERPFSRSALPTSLRALIPPITCQIWGAGQGPLQVQEGPCQLPCIHSTQDEVLDKSFKVTGTVTQLQLKTRHCTNAE